MEKAGSSDLLSRRLSTVKVVVDLLNHELGLGKSDKVINIERERLDAAVTTLEMYIGDVEGVLRGGHDDRRLVETVRPTASRVN